MAFVLTPDMLRCPDCRSDRITQEETPESGFRCAACGTFMQRHGAVISGLPKTMASNTEANLGHYEEMAHCGDSLLARRAKTRNHRIKFDTIAGITELGGDGPRKSVFEVGAGAGTHGAEFARRGHHYVGLDISAAALYRAAAENAVLVHAPLLAGDATRIPLGDNLFDVVFCVATLHHLPEPLDGLREMVRVLKPGGIFCFMEPRWYYPTQLYGYFCHPDVEVGTFKITSGRLLRALRECGVKEARVAPCVYTPNSPAVLIPLFDVIDQVCAAVSVLHPMSVVRCTHGVK